MALNWLIIDYLVPTQRYVTPLVGAVFSIVIIFKLAHDVTSAHGILETLLEIKLSK